MNCTEYESAWNERLDARDTGPAPSLKRHAAECPACWVLGARYHALSQAIQALEPLLMSPAGFVDRVLAAESARPAVVPMPRRVVWRLAPFAAAAAALIPVVFLIPRAWPPAPERPAATVAHVRTIEPDGLTQALAVATSATWDLARETSAPAARVGRQVLVSADLRESAPSLLLPAGVTPAADVWQAVGDRVNAGVGPLEGTARHAFSFLLGPSPDGKPAPRRDPAGA
jgi:hypothetical protein